MKTFAILLSLTFSAALMRADITTITNAAGGDRDIGSGVSTRLAHDYAPLVGDFSRFESNDKTRRFGPSVPIMITATSRKNFRGRQFDASQSSIMPGAVPEAGTLGLMGIGMLGIALVARRRITSRMTDVRKSSS